MSATKTEATQLAEIELVMDQTNTLTVPDAEREALIASLKPVAELIPVATANANALVVKSQQDADLAAGMMAQIDDAYKSAEKCLREFNGGLIDRLYRTHRQWTGLINKFKPLADSKAIIKRKVMEWQLAEEEKARQEQARLQAIADEQARKERARLEAEAAKLKTPEKRAERLEQAAQVVAPVIHVEAPKAPVKMQMRWKVKAFDLTAMGVPEEIQGYIEVKVSNLERAKAANPMLKVPGVEFHQVAV